MDQRPVPHHDPKHHVTPRRTYFVIFFALMVLTAITVWVAFIDLGPLSTPIALGIAITKASLVLLYFMHLRSSTRVTWVVLVASFLWLGVLFVLTFSDYISRRWDPNYNPPFAEVQAEVRQEAPAAQH